MAQVNPGTMGKSSNPVPPPVPPGPAGARWTADLRQEVERLNEHVRQLESQMEQMKSDLRAALREAEELRDAVAARDTFIGTAGHELRNAVGGILVAATNLRFRAARDAGVPSWVSERLDLMTRQSRSFVRRATTLLDVSRISTGGVRLNLARMAWTEVVLDVSQELSAEAERAGCEVEISAEEPVSGHWDRDALEQVTFNLLSNAIKYGAGKPVGVAIAREGGQAVLSVRDHGIGIGEGDRRRIFERFERAVRSEDLPGFGLGLWIARQLVEAHEGTIDVAAAPGAGSLFTVRLPGAIQEPSYHELARVPSEA